MSVLLKGIIGSIFVMSLLAPVSAASLQDKYEVARTKLLYLLSIGSFADANALLAEKSGLFAGSEFDSNWLYLTGLANAKQGKLDEAAVLLRQLSNQPTANSQWLYDLAVIELKLNNPNAAKKALQEWLTGNPKHFSGRYYLAMSEYQLANYQAAVEGLLALESDIEAQASNELGADKILYLLAASAYQGNQSALALRSAQKVIDFGGSDYESSAKLIKINIRNKQSKIWSVELIGKASYDSNVALAIDSEAQDDFRATLQLDASVQPLQPLTLNYNGALTEHAEVNDYNLQSHKLSVYVNPGFKQVTTGLGYSYSQLFLDKELWQHQHRVYLDAQWRKFALSSGLIAQSYPTSSSQNGYQADASGTLQITQVNKLPAVSVHLGAKTQVNEQWETKSIGGNTGIALVAALANWQLQAKGDVSYTEYAPDSVQDSKLLASSSLLGSRILFSNLRLTLSADTFWVLASPEQFDYQRSVISTALAWRF